MVTMITGRRIRSSRQTNRTWARTKAALTARVTGKP
jgi:hypothetical protein